MASVLEISPGNSLVFDHIPAAAGALTFVCVNPLTGDRAMWANAIAEAVQAEGHGLVSYNLRGQAQTAFDAAAISQASIVSDLCALMDHVRPSRPVYAGLSVGGLFAAQAHLAGGAGAAKGLVFINTLRIPGPRINWINDALVAVARTGGLDLLRDVYGPLLFNEQWQAANASQFLTTRHYTGLSGDDGALALLKAGRQVNWDIAWEQIQVPVLNITGLQDRMFLNRNDVEKLLARMPRTRHVEMADAGHMIPAERPAALAAQMNAFARELAAPS